MSKFTFAGLPIGPEHEADAPAIRLWRTVLDSALQDCLRQPAKHIYYFRGIKTEEEKRGECGGFYDVCAFARLDPDWALDRVAVCLAQIGIEL